MMVFATVLDPTKLLPADFFTFLLPWIFSFVVVYGLLDKLNIFGDLKPKVNLALSLIFAFFVTAAAGPQMASFFMNLLGNFIQLAVGVLVLVMLLQILNKPLFSEKTTQGTVVLVLTVVLGALLFFGSGGAIPGLKLDSNTATLVFWGVILLVAVWYVTQKS